MRKHGIIYVNLQFLLLLSFILISCSNPANPIKQNSAPVVNAGANKTIALGETVTLEAVATDADGDVLTYAWLATLKPSGSTSNLTSATQATTRFTPDKKGIYDFQVTVSDGSDTAQDTVRVTVNETPIINTPPEVDAGDDQTIILGQTVILEATATDADGDALTYEWAINVKPQNSSSHLTNPNQAATSFIPDKTGIYHLQITVNDGKANTQDTVIISVTDPPLVKNPLVVNAGADQTITLGETATMKAITNTEDDSTLIYNWIIILKPQDSTSNLANANQPTLSFTPDKVGTYTLEINVQNKDESAKDTVNVIVKEAPTINTPPTVDAGADQTITLGETATLQAEANDADSDPLTYNWIITTQPQGSNSNLTNTTQANSNFTPDIQGVYSLLVTVSDGKDSAQDSVSITVIEPEPVNEAPKLSDISSQQSVQAEQITIAFSVLDETPDTLSFSFSSSDQTLVKNKNMHVTGSGSDRTLVITPESGFGSLSVELTVEDSDGLSDSVNFTLTIRQAFAMPKTTLKTKDGYAEAFGNAVDISGDYIIVGSPFTFTEDLQTEYAGSAYVFKHSDEGWVEVQKLRASSESNENYFARDVAMSGNYAIFGARGRAYEGAAYIFELQDDSWVEVSKLIASDAGLMDEFGDSVDISGDYAIVGAHEKSDDGEYSGAAYIFKRSDSGWREVKKLTASDASEYAWFGTSVAISGDYAIIGSSGNKDKGRYTGAVYTFKRSGEDWIEIQKLTASDATEYNYFGSNVAVSGDYMIVSARAELNGDYHSKIYIFKREGDLWIEVQKLTSSDVDHGYISGAIDIAKDYIIIKASSESFEPVSAFVFKRHGDTWKLFKKLTANDAAEHRYSGPVAISKDYVVFSAYSYEGKGKRSGAAYVFQR